MLYIYCGSGNPVGTRIAKEYNAQMCWSLRKLCRAARVSRKTIQRLMDEKDYRPPVKTIERIARALLTTKWMLDPTLPL